MHIARSCNGSGRSMETPFSTHKNCATTCMQACTLTGVVVGAGVVGAAVAAGVVGAGVFTGL